MASNPTASVPPSNPFEGLQHAMAAALQSSGGTQPLTIDPTRAAEVQSRYAQEYAQLWSDMLDGSTQPPALDDRRFTGQHWQGNRFSAYTAALYMLNARAMLELVDALQADAKTQQKIRFGVEQWIAAAAPSNVWALNPDAVQEAVASQGESLRRGVDNMLADLRRGRISQTDEAEFEVGRNVATTEGAVVFENPWFQLIDYKPLTTSVQQRPLLIVPPCINKYYILDLQPANSFVRFALEQGQRVLLVSWRNPDAECAHWSWDDYVEHGVLQAIRVASEIAADSGAATRRKTTARRAPATGTAAGAINALGFCVGGTLLASALAVLAARGEKPVHSVTLLTTMLDFSDTGALDVFIDEASVALREATIGKGGLLRAVELSAAFSSLRPNDLTWNYVVGNYLKGQTPPPFDLLYWNSDGTNMPGPMLAWYLRNTYLENKLCRPGALSIAGAPIDLGRIDMPAYVYASREDHIVPWKTAYDSARLLSGPVRFVLGASGHIAGVINPASKNKRNHWLLDKPLKSGLPAGADNWLARAADVPGSWWTDWARWLNEQAGAEQPAPKAYGGAGYAAIEPAPGRYVKVKA